MNNPIGNQNPLKYLFPALHAVVIFIALFAFSHPAQAQITYTWNAVNGTSANTNWNANANWSDTGGTFPGSAASDIVIFTNTGVVANSTTINNVVTANTTIAFLTYGLTTTSGAFHNTQINPGVTLTVSSNVTIGTAGAAATTPVTMSGTGNFTTTGTGATLAVGGTGTPGTSQTATLTLANGNNNITMGTINIGDPASGVNGGNCTLNPGTGANNLYADTFNLGADKASGFIQWAAASAGSLNIANHTGTGRASITMGNPNSGTGTCKGSLVTAGGTGAGHPVSVLASTLTMGKMGSDTTATLLAGCATNTWDNGTFDVTTILIGVTATDESGKAGLFGNITLGGNAGSTATLIVNSPTGPGGGSFVISDATFGTAGHTTATGILNINNNGIAQIYCPITSAAILNNTNIINLSSGGTLVMEAPADTIGTTAIPIDNVNLNGGTLHLNVNVNFAGTNIVATTVTASGSTTITLDSITNYPGTGTVTFNLISYTGTDPYTGLNNTPVLPSGFSGTLVDDTAKSTVDLQITAGPNTMAPVVGTLTWNGGSGTGNNWSDLNNWNGTNLNAGDTLYFGGNARLNNVNDTSAGTTYSNLTFNAGAGAFVLAGNSITLPSGTGNVTNNSSNPQTVQLGLNYLGNLTLAGGAGGAPLIIGNGLTNTSISGSVGTITLVGTGIITNLFANAASDTNSLAMNSAANWTIVDNPSSTPINATNLGLNILGGGTLNFGNAGSAPVLATSTEGQNSDSALGDTGTAATLNVVNGTLTLGRRLDTQNANINVSGGTLNVWNQIQMVNSALGNVANLNVTGGTLDILNSSGTSAGGGMLYIASRGTGTVTISGAGTLVECGTLDLSRNAISGTVGTLYLDGGTLKVGSKISTATANAIGITSPVPSATFYFNGGTLQPNISSGTVPLQGSTVSTDAIPIMAYVQAGGAIINVPSGKSLWFGEALMHDPALGLNPDGGLLKQGVGVLTLVSNATYTGNTTISAGTLQFTNSITVATTNIIVGSNATFDVSAMLSTFTLGSGQTLTGNGTNGLIVGSVNLGSGALALTYTNGVPTLKETTNGSIQAINSATFTLNNNAVSISVSGNALAAGSYLLIATNLGGSVAGSVASSTLTITGAGVTAPGSLQIIGNQLYLVVGATTTALTSSENPSGFLDNLNFTAAVQTNSVTAGNATGMVIFQTNNVPFSTNTVAGGSATSASLNTLPRGINLITAIYSGDSNYLPSTNTLNQTVTNHPPVASLVTVTLNAGITSLKIALTDLATNWSDVDGDAISFVSVNNSTNDATVVTNGGYVLYNNPNNVNDQFSYVITDPLGATATGLVNIVINGNGVFGQTSPSITTTGGAPTLSFAGIPGYSYSVQVSTDLTVWNTVWTTNAPSNGLFQFTDNSAPQPTAYYRLQWNP